MKKTAMMLILACMLLLGAQAVSAADDIVVFYNNERVTFDVQPVIMQDRTMVPLRGVFEKMGCVVSWDDNTREIDVTKGDININLGVGRNTMKKNDQTVTIDVPPVIQASRTLIPLRAVSEAFDCNVIWYPLSRIVEITDVAEVGDMPVEKEDYVLTDATGYASAPVDESFFAAENWTYAQNLDNGIQVFMGDTFVPSYYTKEMMSDKLFTFRMTINDPNSWPTIAFNANNTTDYYEIGDCYMFNFYAGHIGLQRFNQGMRTVIMDDAELGEQVVGDGVLLPNGKPLQYGQEYEVTMGTLREENGVRVILIVDGETVINYLDRSGKRLEEGYMGIYVGTGNFVFTPVTAQDAE